MEVGYDGEVEVWPCWDGFHIRTTPNISQVIPETKLS
jgi:hypothetical protein